MKDEANNWGFYLPNYQKWVDHKEGMEKYALEPCYGIHADPFDYKGYVHLQIPKGEDILYPFIDFIYESWGIENIGIREQEQSVFISMKAGVGFYPKFDSFSYEPADSFRTGRNH